MELNDLAESFKQVRDTFLATYDEELTRWKAQHPGYEHLIEAELLPKAFVGSKFAFCYEVFAINPNTDVVEGAFHEGFPKPADN